MPLLSEIQPRPESFMCVVRAIYACGRIEDDIAVGEEEWMRDLTRQDAVTYRLVVLGECLKRFVDLYEGSSRNSKQGRTKGARNRDERFLDLSPEDYTKLIKLRDRLAHLTAGHDLNIIWHFAAVEVPPIAHALQKGGRWATPAWLERKDKTREEEFVAAKTNEWLKEEIPRIFGKLQSRWIKDVQDALAIHDELFQSVQVSFKAQNESLVERLLEIQRQQTEEFRRNFDSMWKESPPNLPLSDVAGDEGEDGGPDPEQEANDGESGA